MQGDDLNVLRGFPVPMVKRLCRRDQLPLTRVFVRRASNPVERMAAQPAPLGPIRITRATTGSALCAQKVIQLMQLVQFQILLVMKNFLK